MQFRYIGGMWPCRVEDCAANPKESRCSTACNGHPSPNFVLVVSGGAGGTATGTWIRYTKPRR